MGIVPGNGRHEAKSIQPFLEVLLDELITLSNATLYDAYQQATFQLKVEILLHILDYPGIAKVFNIADTGAYKGCAWCDIRGTLLLGNIYTYVYIVTHGICAHIGVYNKALSKMVYLDNRRFLPPHHH